MRYKFSFEPDLDTIHIFIEEPHEDYECDKKTIPMIYEVIIFDTYNYLHLTNGYDGIMKIHNW